MSETCAVCHRGKGPEKCEVCGFSDNGSINRQFPIPEDAKNWLETVVKPYRARWEAGSQPTLPLIDKEQISSRFIKGAIALLVIIVFVVIIKFLLNSDYAAKAYLDSGDAYYKKGDYDNAIKEYTAALEIKPEEPIYFNNRARAYYSIKDYGNAIKDYTAALKIKPDDPVYLNNRGLASYNKGNYFDAIKDYTAALMIKPDDPIYLSNRGKVHYVNEDYDAAIEDYAAAIEIQPNDPVYFNNRGRAYYGLKDYDNAIKDYTAALKIKPEDPVYLNNRGNAYYNKKNYDLAIKDFETALRINPNYDLANKQLKNVWKILGIAFADSRDGKIYIKVKIGNQTWMAENLNYNIKNSRCYDDNPDNCKKYGRLYDWEAAKKACPIGWHLPSNGEWKTLINFAGGAKTAGKKLKARSGWNGYGNGEDTYRFSALPGSFCSTLSSSCCYKCTDGIGNLGRWWTSSESNSEFYIAYDRIMSTNEETVRSHNDFYGDGSFKSHFLSVRCVQNNPKIGD